MDIYIYIFSFSFICFCYVLMNCNVFRCVVWFFIFCFFLFLHGMECKWWFLCVCVCVSRNHMREWTMSISELDDGIVRSMAVGAIFTDFVCFYLLLIIGYLYPFEWSNLCIQVMVGAASSFFFFMLILHNQSFERWGFPVVVDGCVVTIGWED